MSSRLFVARSRMPAPSAEVFAWHARPGALERLIPPWSRVEVVERTGGIEDGARVVLRVYAGPLPQRWVAVHRGFVPGRQFEDEQVEGPFAFWRHTHRIEPDGAEALLEDRIEYALPGGWLGDLLGRAHAEASLRRIFAYRHAVTRGDLERHLHGGPVRPLTIGITGASGLVGSRLVPFLSAGGHQVRRFVRRAPRDAAEIGWDPAAGSLDPGALDGLDAVIHLSGESVAGSRWTAERKDRILRSRVDSTRLLAKSIARAVRPPRVLICASAIGIYGDRGDEILDEASQPGTGFLPAVCRQWEEATAPAAERGVRSVQLRVGTVLSGAGGALSKLVLPFQMGAGGRIGTGRQWMSWIALDDLLGLVLFLLRADTVCGPVNAVAPGSVMNAEFAATLARVVRRPALLPLPEIAVRLALGEMADALLLSSTRVRPNRLEAAGFSFRHPSLDDALRFELGRFTVAQLDAVGSTVPYASPRADRNRGDATGSSLVGNSSIIPDSSGLSSDSAKEDAPWPRSIPR